MKNRSSPTTTSLRQKIALVFLGLILSIVLLETGMRLGGFVLLSMQECENLRSVKQKGSYRILCLGESTTQGEYPKPLEQILNRRNIGVHFSVLDKGITGVSTSAILGRVESYLVEYHPDMVVAMMGINDHGIPYYQDISESRSWIFRHCRVYRLGRILYGHFLKKLRKSEVSIGGTSKSDLNVKLGRRYREQGDFSQAEDSLEKAIEIDPENAKAYVELGRLFQAQLGCGCLQAESFYKKAIEIDPRNVTACAELGALYRCQRKFLQAEDLCKRAVELDPGDVRAFFELGWLYRDQGKFSQAEAIYKKGIDLNYGDDRIRLLGAMASLCEETGKPELAHEYVKKMVSEDSVAFTVNNYRKLKEILDRKGIKLVCVQYPARNIEPLKRIFEKDKGVIFVDNESVFKEAVKRGGYKEYFRDMFAGDFGHCTQKGNMLLAQNIADVILREVFNKS